MTESTAIIPLQPRAQQTALALVTAYDPHDEPRAIQRARYHTPAAQEFLRQLSGWIRDYGSRVGNDWCWIIPNAPIANVRIEATAHTDGSLLVVSGGKMVCDDSDSESLVFNVGTRALWVQALIEQHAIEMRKAEHRQLLTERKRENDAQERARAVINEDVSFAVDMGMTVASTIPVTRFQGVTGIDVNSP